MPRQHAKRARRSSRIQGNEIKLPKGKRSPKPTLVYQEYQQNLKKNANRFTIKHWKRSRVGDHSTVVTPGLVSESLTSNNPELIAASKQFMENLKQSRGYIDNSLIKFDSADLKQTPKKARTTTPRRRKLKNIMTTRFTFKAGPLAGQNIRLASFQEEGIYLKDKQYISESESEEDENFYKKHSIKQPKTTSITVERELTRAKKARARKKIRSSEKQKNIWSADNIFSQQINSPASPFDAEQKKCHARVHHELSHLIAKSHGGPDIVLPTTEGHNSKRIPIEVLAAFFVKLGLKVKFKTEDALLLDKVGNITRIPYHEVVTITLPDIGSSIRFELNPLCPEQPVNGCYDITKAIALLVLAGTAYYAPATQEIEKQNKRRKAKAARSSDEKIKPPIASMSKTATLSHKKSKASQRKSSKKDDVVLVPYPETSFITPKKVKIIEREPRQNEQPEVVSTDKDENQSSTWQPLVTLRRKKELVFDVQQELLSSELDRAEESSSFGVTSKLEALSVMSPPRCKSNPNRDEVLAPSSSAFFYSIKQTKIIKQEQQEDVGLADVDKENIFPSQQQLDLPLPAREFSGLGARQALFLRTLTDATPKAGTEVSPTLGLLQSSPLKVRK